MQMQRGRLWAGRVAGGQMSSVRKTFAGLPTDLVGNQLPLSPKSGLAGDTS
jgi:hypothetical protein